MKITIKNLKEVVVTYRAQFGYLVIGKMLSLLIIFSLYTLYPDTFDSYARISMSGSLLAGVAILGLPYAVQFWSQDFKLLMFRVMWPLCLFFMASTFIFLSFIGSTLVIYLSVLVVGFSSIWMAHLTEVLQPRIYYIYHMAFISLTQPLMFIVNLYVPELPLAELRWSFIFSIIFIIVSSIYLFSCLRDYLRIFLIQSLTVLLGSGFVAYLLSSSIMSDTDLHAGFLWLLVQFASLAIFITNSMSFRLISYFSLSGSGVKNIGAAVAGYGFLCALYVMSFLIVLFYPTYSPYVYVLYLLSQGFSKVIGSLVISLRVPSIQLLSAFFSLVSLLFFTQIYENIEIFYYGVMCTLVASFGGSLSMVFVLKNYSYSIKR